MKYKQQSYSFALHSVETRPATHKFQIQQSFYAEVAKKNIGKVSNRGNFTSFP